MAGIRLVRAAGMLGVLIGLGAAVSYLRRHRPCYRSDRRRNWKLPLMMLRAAGTRPPIVLLFDEKPVVMPSSLPSATSPVTSVPIRLP